MLSFFPALHDEELFYSGGARYTTLMAYVSGSYTVRDMFGEAGFGKPVIDFPTRLGSFIKQLPASSTLTADEIIRRHSQLPYYAHFASQEQFEKAYAWMAAEISKRRPFWIRATRPQYLQFCPACAKHDSTEVGAPIWRRVHQLPGVLMCPIHGEDLRAVPETRRMLTDKYRYVALDDDAISRSLVLNVPSESRPLFERLAKGAHWLLTNSDNAIPVAETRKKLLGALRRANWFDANGSYRRVEIVAAMQRHIGAPALMALGCALNKSRRPSDTWLGEVCTRREGLTPLRLLLVLEFLGVPLHRFFSEDMPIGEGYAGPNRSAKVEAEEREFKAPDEAPCANRACSSFLESPIASEWARKLEGPSIVRCATCGLSYRFNPAYPKRWRIKDPGPVWSSALAEMFDRRVSRNQMAKALGLSIAGLQNRLVMAGLIPPPMQRRPTRKQLSAAALERHRARWLKALSENPMHSIIDLVRVVGQVTYQHLRDRDKDGAWLKAHLPPDRSVNRLGARWAALDQQLLDKARAAVTEILASSARPKKITWARIGRAVCGRPISIHYYRRAVQFTTFVYQSCESSEDFARRKYRWSISTYEAEGAQPTFTDAVTRAGLRCRRRYGHLTEEFRALWQARWGSVA